MCTINVNVVQGRSYERFQYKNLRTKVSSHKHFQIYGNLLGYCISDANLIALTLILLPAVVGRPRLSDRISSGNNFLIKSLNEKETIPHNRF